MQKGAKHGHCARVGVEGIDKDGARTERLRGADEFGEDEHTVVLLLARNELEGDFGHALAQRRDQADVGEEVECDELFNKKERAKWRRKYVSARSRKP